MKEMLESLSETIRERFKSPFFGTFIIAWIVINWRIILFLTLSNDPIAIRIHIAEIMYLSPAKYFVFPTLLTLIYLIIPGFIMQEVEKINVNSIKSRKDIRANLLEHEYEIRGKQAELENDLEDIKAKNRDKKALNDKIELLSNQLAEREKLIENLKLEITKTSKLDQNERKKITKSRSGGVSYRLYVNYNRKHPSELDIMSKTIEKYGTRLEPGVISADGSSKTGTIDFVIYDHTIMPNDYAVFLQDEFEIVPNRILLG